VVTVAHHFAVLQLAHMQADALLLELVAALTKAAVASAVREAAAEHMTAAHSGQQHLQQRRQNPLLLVVDDVVAEGLRVPIREAATQVLCLCNVHLRLLHDVLMYSSDCVSAVV
jgi:hypothetical protein